MEWIKERLQGVVNKIESEASMYEKHKKELSESNGPRTLIDHLSAKAECLRKYESEIIEIIEDLPEPPKEN